MSNKFNDTVLQFTQYGMGSGDQELGLVLVKNYINLLLEEEELPKFICFYNEGVRLLSSQSPCIDAFAKLEERGVKLMACKTCLNHFQLLDDLKAGIVATMVDIMDLHKMAGKLITV